MSKIINFFKKYLHVLSIIVLCGSIVFLYFNNSLKFCHYMFFFSTGAIWSLLMFCNSQNREFYRFTTKTGFFYLSILLLTISILWQFETSMFWAIALLAVVLIVLSRDAGYLFSILFVSALALANHYYDELIEIRESQKNITNCEEQTFVVEDAF